MVLSIKDSGKTIKLTAKVFSGMFMETSMKVIGREIRLMDMVNILTVMEPLTRVTGEMIFSMDEV
jgi:hypothetical protein